MTGEIARCHAQLTKLSDDLEHLDATLRLFAPDFVAESILPKVFTPPKSWSKRGAVVSKFYNQTSVLRTIGRILGLPPLNAVEAHVGRAVVVAVSARPCARSTQLEINPAPSSVIRAVP